MTSAFNIAVKISLPSLKAGNVDRGIANGLEAAALHMESKAKDNITPFTRTGRLRSSVTHEVRGRTAIIGTNVVYARPVEYGHHSFRGHHYMQKTFREEAGRAEAEFRVAFNRVVN